MPKCEICDKDHDSLDHYQETAPLDIVLEETSPLDIIIQEHHNPLDIPFGHEVNEINMEVKGPEDVDEGGMGSGRNPEGGDNGGSSAPGPLVSFGINETILKQLYDEKLKESCKCHKKN